MVLINSYFLEIFRYFGHDETVRNAMKPILSDLVAARMLEIYWVCLYMLGH